MTCPSAIPDARKPAPGHLQSDSQRGDPEARLLAATTHELFKAKLAQQPSGKTPNPLLEANKLIQQSALLEPTGHTPPVER